MLIYGTIRRVSGCELAFPRDWFILAVSQKLIDFQYFITLAITNPRRGVPQEEHAMNVKSALGKTCIWCVMIAAGLLSLLAVAWIVILAGSPG